MKRFSKASWALGLGMAMTAQLALAQQASENLEKITVTGSAIPRTDTETAAPVQVITREAIERSGATSLQEVLHALTANGEGNLNQGFSGAFAAGAAGIALRGMTVDATLVLIDGHRMAPYPISDDGQRSFVDVSNLPLSAIDHIEVLKDGASAAYGSDAIAGVVNVILRKTVVGGQVSGTIGTSNKGDGGTRHVSATYGFGDLAAEGSNTYFNFEYRHQDNIMLSSRPEYANFNYTPQYGPSAPVTPGVLQPGSAYNIVNTPNGMILPWSTGGIVGTTPSLIQGCANPPASGGCAYDQSKFYQIQPDTGNINLLVRHTMNITSDWQATFTGSLFQSKAEQWNPPSSTLGITPGLSVGTINTGDPTAQPILLPVGNPSNPYAQPAWLGYLFSDVGPTITTTSTNMWRFVGDLNGRVAGWDLKSSLGYIRGITGLEYSNYVQFAGLNAALASGAYAPGVTTRATNPSVYQQIAPTTDATATSEMFYGEVNASRDIPVNLPGGPMSVSVGASAHHLSQQDPGQPDTINGGTLGLGTTFIHGSELNEAIFGELDAPVFKFLDVLGQARFDKYPATGDAFTPKINIKFTPIQQLALRATYGRGFRAPGPGEKGTNSGVTFYTSSPNDKKRCPTTGLPGDCGTGTIAGVNVGEPNLLPEKSESYTAGIVLQPIKEASVSVDWYKVRRVNEIVGGAGVVTYVRGPVQPKYPNLPGPIVALLAPYQNEGSDTTSGIDVDFRGKINAAFGTLNLGATYTKIMYQRICATPDPATCVEVAGTHGPTGISGDTGTPKDRAQGTFSYGRGDGEIGVIVNYVSGYRNTDPTFGFFGANPPGDCLNPWFTKCYIASFTEWDLFGHYDVTKQLQFNGHILNLFGRDAPFDPQAAYGTRNYNNAFAQQGAIGRFFEVGLRYSF